MMRLIEFLIATVVAGVIGWRGVVATWRNDRRSLFVRHPEPPAWYPLGRTWYLASARGIVFAGVLIVVIWGGYVASLLTTGALGSATRTALVAFVVLTLLGYVLVGLLARPKWLVPPALRSKPPPLGLLIDRFSAARRGR
jgi:hypothetical protein